MEPGPVLEPLNLQALRNAVAEKHKVLLGDDDPVLVTALLCDEVLRRFLSRIEFAAQVMEKAGAGRMNHELVEVKKTAETMIEGASQFAVEEIRRAGEDAQRRINEALDSRVLRLQKAFTEVDAARTTAIYAAIGAGGAALLAIGLLLGKLLLG